jgi:hypothetical protein
MRILSDYPRWPDPIIFCQGSDFPAGYLMGVYDEIKSINGVK